MVSMIYFRAPEDEERGFPGIAVLGEEDDGATNHFFLFFSKFQGFQLLERVTAAYPERADDRHDLEECPLPAHSSRDLALIAVGNVAIMLMDAIYVCDVAEVALPVDTSAGWDVFMCEASDEGPPYALCCLNAEKDGTLYAHLAIIYSLNQYRNFKQKYDPEAAVEDESYRALQQINLPETSAMISVLLWGDLAQLARSGLAEMRRDEEESDAAVVQQEVAEAMEAEGLSPHVLMRVPSGSEGGLN